MASSLVSTINSTSQQLSGSNMLQLKSHVLFSSPCLFLRIDLSSALVVVVRDIAKRKQNSNQEFDQKVGFLMVYDWVEKLVRGMRSGNVDFGLAKAMESLVDLLEQDLGPRLDFFKVQEATGKTGLDVQQVLWKSLIWQLMEHPVGSLPQTQEVALSTYSDVHSMV